MWKWELEFTVKRFKTYLKRKGYKGNQKKGKSKYNDSNNTHSFSCYNCGKQGHIYKLNVQTLIKEKRNMLTRERRTSPRKDVLTLHEKIMMIQQVVHLKMEMKKQTYVSWLDINHVRKWFGWRIFFRSWVRSSVTMLSMLIVSVSFILLKILCSMQSQSTSSWDTISLEG